MLAEKKAKKLIFWSFVCLFVNSFLIEFPKAHINISSSNYFIVLYISVGCLVYLYSKSGWKQDVPKSTVLMFHLVMVCNLVGLVRGFLTAANYYDWKNAFIESGGGLSLLIPLAMMVGVNFLYSQKLMRFCLLVLTYGFLIIPVVAQYESEIYSRLMSMVVFMLLLVPFFKLRQSAIILVVAIVSAVISIAWRANVLHIALSLLFLLIYYFRKVVTRQVLTVLQIAFFVIPFYFLYQGITTGKSVFRQDDNTEMMVSNKGEEENLAADTRTEIYEEVLTDLHDTNDIWLGRGANGKYKTEFDWGLIEALSDERPNVEVGFLKTLIQTGVLGLLLYGIVIGLAVYYGTNQTNNTLTKMIATYLASHFAILFIENINDYSIYFYFSWVAIGICFSKTFRSLTDEQIKNWLRYSR